MIAYQTFLPIWQSSAALYLFRFIKKNKTIMPECIAAHTNCRMCVKKSHADNLKSAHEPCKSCQRKKGDSYNSWWSIRAVKKPLTEDQRNNCQKSNWFWYGWLLGKIPISMPSVTISHSWRKCRWKLRTGFLGNFRAFFLNARKEINKRWITNWFSSKD